MLHQRQLACDKLHEMTNAWLNSILGNSINARQRAALHVFAWTVYIGYEIATLYFISRQIGYWVDYVIFYGLNISLFYTNAAILPKAVRGRWKYLKPIPVLFGLMAAYLIVKYTIDCQLINMRGEQKIIDNNISSYITMNFWRGTFFLIASSFYLAVRWVFRFREVSIKERNATLASEMARAKLETDLIIANNAYLQQQINPHFLFNSLNLIYNSFHKESLEAAACLSKLSDILRYCYKPAYKDNKAPLSAELYHIRQLIELNKLRFDHPLYLNAEIQDLTEEEGNAKILPLVLLTLTENMFKHGNLKDNAHPARLMIRYIAGGILKFRSRNWKRKWAIAHSDGIGLKNTIKRLDYSYPEKYKLNIVDNSDYYDLELQIQL